MLKRFCLVLLLVAFTMSSNAAYAKNWYDGGNLHKAGAMDWQKATHANKLATCSDFLAALWQKKSLKPSLMSAIHSTDDMRVLSEELVRNMDEALSKEKNKRKNEMMYKNQTVSEIAAMLLIMMKWTKSTED